MKRYSGVLLAGAIVLSIFQRSARCQQTTKVYSPNASQLSKLEPEASFLGFAIRVPKGYEFVSVPEQLEGAITFACLGTPRSNKTRPTIQLTFIKPPASVQKNITLNYAVNEFASSLKHNRSPYNQSEVEAGTINGLVYKHATWTGASKTEHGRMQGSFYITKDRDMIIELVCQDVVPGAESTISLLDSCLRTLRKVSQRLYFSVQWPDHSKLWSMNPDGTDRTCLTPDSDTDYHPAVSPDGKTVAFTTHRTGTRSIWLMNSDGSNQRAVTKKEDAGQCAWSPDGDRLTFSSNRDGKYCIYTMKVDGTDVKKISEGPSDDWPSWASSNSIVYESRINGIWTVMSTNAEGNGAKKALTDSKAHARWPNISPDGGYILYTTYVDDTGKLCHIGLMKSDGSTKTPLTDGPKNERQASWSADGGQILFHSDRQGRYETYVMDSNTLTPRRLASEAMETQEITTAGRAFAP